jgi:hypothetical protein
MTVAAKLLIWFLSMMKSFAKCIEAEKDGAMPMASSLKRIIGSEKAKPTVIAFRARLRIAVTDCNLSILVAADIPVQFLSQGCPYTFSALISYKTRKIYLRKTRSRLKRL